MIQPRRRQPPRDRLRGVPILRQDRAGEPTTEPEQRRFDAIFYLLPEARPYFASGVGRESKPGSIDSYRDNWWCPFDVRVDLDSRSNWALRWGHEEVSRRDGASVRFATAFVRDDDADRAKSEIEKLTAAAYRHSQWTRRSIYSLRGIERAKALQNRAVNR